VNEEEARPKLKKKLEIVLLLLLAETKNKEV
jgi:hypothetical protein